MACSYDFYLLIDEQTSGHVIDISGKTNIIVVNNILKFPKCHVMTIIYTELINHGHSSFLIFAQKSARKTVLLSK